MKEQNVEISYGNSKKYGTVTKYKLPDGNRCHRGYKLGREYTDSAIKKRIENRLRGKAHTEDAKAFRQDQKETARAYRQEQKRIAKAHDCQREGTGQGQPEDKSYHQNLTR